MKLFVTLFISFGSLLIVSSCNKDDKRSECFKLKVVYVYQGSNTACASNILEVLESQDSEIPTGTLVSITHDEPYTEHPDVAAIIYLKVKLKNMIVPGIDPICPFNYTYHLHGNLCQ